MTAELIQKYKNYTHGSLLGRTQRTFNEFIRLRDKDLPCVSCGSYNTSTASHFYSVGHYGRLRFDEANCHLSCTKCNMYLSGNLNEYRKRIVSRIGTDGLKRLDDLAAIKGAHKYDRFTLIAINEEYRAKVKALKNRKIWTREEDIVI